MGTLSLKPPKSAESFNVLIEIPAHSFPIKYELDEEVGLLKVDRFMLVSMFYPCNYGFISGTLGGDGDCLDALVITRYPLKAKCTIEVRAIGILIMKDEAGSDEKILCVPVSKVDSFYDNIKQYTDLPSIQLKEIEHFFSHYKELEKNKFVEVIGWQPAEVAYKLILDTTK